MVFVISNFLRISVCDSYKKNNIIEAGSANGKDTSNKCQILVRISE